MRRAGPSQVRPADRYCVRIYLQHSVDPQLFDNVKHAWVQADTDVLVILQMFDDDETYRYVYWPMDRLLWWQVTTMRSEAIWRACDNEGEAG